MQKKEFFKSKVNVDSGPVRRTISKDLTYGLIIAVTIVSVAIITSNYLILSEKAKVRLEQKADEYLIHLIDSLEVPLWNLDYEIIEKICGVYFKNDHVSRLRITESFDNVIFYKEKEDISEVVERAGELKHKDQVIGSIVIGLASNLYKRSNRRLLWSNLLTLVLIILTLAGATGLLLRLFLNRPFDNLLEGIDRIAKGHYDYRFPTAKQKEIEEIISRFNSMGTKVKAREDTLNEVNQRLEKEMEVRQRAEEALGSSEERYRTLIHRIQAAVVVHGADTKIISSNHKAQELLGLTENQLLGKTAIDPEWKFLRVDGEKMSFAEYPVNQVMATKQPLRELTAGIYRPPKDDPVWVLVNADPVFGDSGEIQQVVITFMDITKRKKIEEELREVYNKLKAVIMASPVAIVLLNKEGEVTLWSPAAEKIFGWKEVEVIGRYNPVVPSERKGEFNQNLKGVLLGESITDLELIRMRKDGSQIYILLSVAPLLNTEGETYGVAGMITDITDRKRAEEELARHRDHLEELVKERTEKLKTAQAALIKQERLAVLGQLTATVSHELRNPLGVIRTSSFYLQQKCKDQDEKIKKHLNRIEDQVEICDSIVGELLEFTRGRHSHTVEGEINLLLDQILNDIQETVDVKIKKSLAGQLPKVFFDGEKMRRVFVNLLDNALQAVSERKLMEEDETYPSRIEVVAKRTDSGVMIMVEDNGIGMGEETMERAFEPLFTTKARGTGLGLANVRKIIEEHNGSVSLESEPNKGTKAIVNLPAA